MCEYNLTDVVLCSLSSYFFFFFSLFFLFQVRSRRGNAFLWNESFQEQLVAHASKIGLLGAPHPDTPDVFPTGMFGTADEKAAVKRKKDVKKLF